MNLNSLPVINIIFVNWHDVKVVLVASPFCNKAPAVAAAGAEAERPGEAQNRLR